jgi:hypothetical protein
MTAENRHHHLKEGREEQHGRDWDWDWDWDPCSGWGKCEGKNVE